MTISENLKHILDEPSLIIVINKIDELEPEGLEMLQQKFNGTAHLTSAATKTGTDKLFEIICKEGSCGMNGVGRVAVGGCSSQCWRLETRLAA